MSKLPEADRVLRAFGFDDDTQPWTAVPTEQYEALTAMVRGIATAGPWAGFADECFYCGVERGDQVADELAGGLFVALPVEHGPDCMWATANRLIAG